jgi:hypothetical protein
MSLTKLSLSYPCETTHFPFRIIEEVILKSCPTPLGKRQRSLPEEHMKPRDRIEKIVNDLFEFGVPVDLLFDVDDLLKSKNIPKVNILI